MTSVRLERRTLVVGAVLGGLLLLLVGIVAGRLTAPGAPPSPSNTSAEAGFARDMQLHHQQAVRMAMEIYGKTDDPDIRTLSYDIATAQSAQAGQMYGWLDSWSLPQSSAEPTMTWMTRPVLSGSGHGHGDDMAHEPGSRMPGLATDEQLAELDAATGTAADRLFLELMIPHHEGGVEMAEAILDRSDVPVVRSLATGVVTSQTGEIGYMRDLLAGLSG